MNDDIGRSVFGAIFEPLSSYREHPVAEMEVRSRAFAADLAHFVVVSDPGLKRRIREAAERAEREFYAQAPQEWLDALAPLGTDAHKPYLETARRTNYYVMESFSAKCWSGRPTSDRSCWW